VTVDPATAPVATGNYPTALLAFPDRMPLQPDFAQAASASGVPQSLLEHCAVGIGLADNGRLATGALGVCQILPSTGHFHKQFDHAERAARSPGGGRQHRPVAAYSAIC